MITRKINKALFFSSNVATVLMKIGFAFWGAKLVWWLLTPSYNDVYIDKTRITQKDNSIKYIINRYPFGEVVIIKPKDNTPLFSTLVKLHGVYVNGENSMAFVTYNDKNYAVKLNNTIASIINVVAINPDSIIITKGDESATIKITKSNIMPNITNSHSPNNNFNNNQNNNNNNYNNTNSLMQKREELLERVAKQELDNTQNSNTNTNSRFGRNTN